MCFESLLLSNDAVEALVTFVRLATSELRVHLPRGTEKPFDESFEDRRKDLEDSLSNAVEVLLEALHRVEGASNYDIIDHGLDCLDISSDFSVPLTHSPPPQRGKGVAAGLIPPRLREPLKSGSMSAALLRASRVLPSLGGMIDSHDIKTAAKRLLQALGDIFGLNPTGESPGDIGSSAQDPSGPRERRMWLALVEAACEGLERSDEALLAAARADPWCLCVASAYRESRWLPQPTDQAPQMARLVKALSSAVPS